jgi:membrane protein YqaA with SNARE-associated domain
MTAACTFFPLPTPPVVIYMGALHDPLVVALVGGVASCLAGLIDYFLFLLLLQHGRVRQFQGSSFYRSCAAFFKRIAFFSLVLAAFTPIPFDPFRLLAIASGYNRAGYLTAIFIGRAPRYYLLAKLGGHWHIPPYIVVASIILLAAFSILRNWKGMRFNLSNAARVWRRRFKRRTIK